MKLRDFLRFKNGLHALIGGFNKKNRVIFTSTDNFIIVSSDNYIFTGVK